MCYPAKVHVIRPSDVLIGKLMMKTATDWVTRGHSKVYICSFLLKYILWWLNVQSGQCKQVVSIAGRQSDV